MRKAGRWPSIFLPHVLCIWVQISRTGTISVLRGVLIVQIHSCASTTVSHANTTTVMVPRVWRLARSSCINVLTYLMVRLNMLLDRSWLVRIGISRRSVMIVHPVVLGLDQRHAITPLSRRSTWTKYPRRAYPIHTTAITRRHTLRSRNG